MNIDGEEIFKEHLEIISGQKKCYNSSGVKIKQTNNKKIKKLTRSCTKLLWQRWC